MKNENEKTTIAILATICRDVCIYGSINNRCGLDKPVDTDALRSSIEQEVKSKYSAQLEELQQRADAAPDPEAIRKEAEREAAKEYKAKLATAKADAEKKAKAAVEKLEQEKADLKRQLDSSATKLDAAVRQAKAAGADTDVAACRVYFTELQQTAAKVQELIGKINAKDPATGAKLSAAVISVLQSTAKGIWRWHNDLRAMLPLRCVFSPHDRLRPIRPNGNEP